MIGQGDDQHGQAFRSLVLGEVGSDRHPGLGGLEGDGGEGGVGLDLRHLQSYISQAQFFTAGTRNWFNLWYVD